MTSWYTEEEQGKLKYSYAMKRKLFSGKSPFQLVEVIDTEVYGRMLLIDGLVMITEKDEFVYHEMISHIPMCYHSHPKKVLVIGGGDGGTVRELLKHTSVEKIVLCEIDSMVVEASRQFFPEISKGLSNEKVELIIGDGIKYIESLEGEVDVIIIDSTDPIGPGEGLFTGDFYKSVNRALREGGIMAAQSESPWDGSEMIQRIYKNISTGFEYIKPYTGPVPTYPRGLWSWTLASNAPIVESNFNLSAFADIQDSLRYLTLSKAKYAFDISPFHKEKLGIIN